MHYCVYHFKVAAGTGGANFNYFIYCIAFGIDFVYILKTAFSRLFMSLLLWSLWSRFSSANTHYLGKTDDAACSH